MKFKTSWGWKKEKKKKSGRGCCITHQIPNVNRKLDLRLRANIVDSLNNSRVDCIENELVLGINVQISTFFYKLHTVSHIC